MAYNRQADACITDAPMSTESAQITQVRLPSGKTIALVDWTDKPLYSTVDLLSGFNDQVIQAFNYIVSDQVSASQNFSVRRTATDRDTNITSPGTLAATEELLVYNIKVEPSQFIIAEDESNSDATKIVPGAGGPIIEAQLLSWLHYRLQLQLEVSQKLYADAGLGYYNQGFGTYFMGTTGTADGQAPQRTYGAQGFMSADAPRSFTVPVHIGGEENYRINLVNAGMGSSLSGGGIDLTAGQVPFLDLAGEEIEGAVVQLRIYLEGLYKRPVS